MIKFFRKIRQRLLTENKFSKYLLYAIGEILLVMIGILLALQINNWNEDRKEKQFEKNLLLELKENLQSDISHNKYQINTQNAHIEHIEGLIRHLNSKLPYNDSLNFVRVVYFESFQVNRSAYESLKSRGFEKLSSKELKKELSKYYDLDVIGRSKIVDRLNEEQRNALENYHWEKRITYQGDQEYQKFMFNLASEGRFYINYFYARKSWKENFINDIVKPNIKQAEFLISIIDGDLK